jgi:glycosyltransferase involved in cell wall biosynthesis
MIVKNESQFIVQCIQSVKELVDEIIVIDTGSKDNTKELALSEGALLYEMEWQDDFATARNLSISYASGDWILVLDADEVIDQSDHDVIIKCINGSKNLCYKFVQRHYVNNHHVNGFIPVKGDFPHWERQAGGYFESELVRLFPRDSSLTFRNKIHELVEPSIVEQEHFEIISLPVLIHHFGHLDHEKRFTSKSQFYLDLGIHKIIDEPHNWKGFYELGIELIAHKRFKDSAQSLLYSIELNPLFKESWINLGYVLAEQGFLAQSHRALECAYKLDPNAPEISVNKGVAFMRSRAYGEASQCFKAAIRLDPTNVLARCNLGETLISLRKLDEALMIYAEALNLFPSCGSAIEGLGKTLFMLNSFEEAFSYFEKLEELGYDKCIAAFWLWKVHEQRKDFKNAIKWHKLYEARIAHQIVC